MVDIKQVSVSGSANPNYSAKQFIVFLHLPPVQLNRNLKMAVIAEFHTYTVVKIQCATDEVQHYCSTTHPMELSMQNYWF